MCGICFLSPIFSSNYCKVVFFLSVALAYFLLPHSLWNSSHAFLAALFLITFSLVTTCVVRGIKEKIVSRNLYGGSVLSLVGSILGIATLQACGLSGPVCLAGLGFGLFTTILPTGTIFFISRYASLFLLVSITLHIVALRHMGCFNQCKGASCQR